MLTVPENGSHHRQLIGWMAGIFVTLLAIAEKPDPLPNGATQADRVLLGFGRHIVDLDVIKEFGAQKEDETWARLSRLGVFDDPSGNSGQTSNLFQGFDAGEDVFVGICAARDPTSSLVDPQSSSAVFVGADSDKPASNKPIPTDLSEWRGQSSSSAAALLKRLF